MKNGTRPADGEEKKTTVQLTIAIPQSMYFEVKKRLKTKRVKDVYYSRNDLMRTMIQNYLDRHPTQEEASA